MVTSKKLALPLMAVQKIVFPFILLALMIFKVSSAAIHINLHHEQEYEHENEDHCGLCENAMFVLNADFSVATEFSVMANEHTVTFHQPKNYYNSTSIVSFSGKSNFVRPPPSLN